METLNPLECSHDQGYEREVVNEQTYARCKGCGSVKRIDNDWPQDWAKVGDEDK